MERIHTERAPQALGPYSQALVAGRYVFTSGQIGIDPSTGKLVEGGIAAQAEQVMANLAAILEEAGTGLDRIVKTTCFLADIADFAAFNEVYGAHVTGRPARSCVAVRDIPAGALCEVEAVATLA